MPGGFQDDQLHAEQMIAVLQAHVGLGKLRGISAEKALTVETELLEALPVGFEASRSEELAVGGVDGDGELVPAAGIALAEPSQRCNVIHMAVGESDAHGDHVQDVDAGGDLPLVSTRIDDDAFLFRA